MKSMRCHPKPFSEEYIKCLANWRRSGDVFAELSSTKGQKSWKPNMKEINHVGYRKLENAYCSNERWYALGQGFKITFIELFVTTWKWLWAEKLHDKRLWSSGPETAEHRSRIPPIYQHRQQWQWHGTWKTGLVEPQYAPLLGNGI
jgi:hypothetical protein